MILAVLATLCLDGSVADYSLYISEERLQSYYSNTAHAELVLGEGTLGGVCVYVYKVWGEVMNLNKVQCVSGVEWRVRQLLVYI